MGHSSVLTCPNCNNNNLMLKYKASYVYSYVIDADAPGINNEKVLLSYIYDKREQTDSQQYVQCDTCGKIYPFYYDINSSEIDYETLSKAIHIE